MSMTNITTQKSNLIRMISAIESPGLLDWLETELKKRQASALQPEYHSDETTNPVSLSGTIRQKLRSLPTPGKFDPEAIKASQQWKNHDEVAIFELIRRIDVQEPIEDLLALLSK